MNPLPVDISLECRSVSHWFGRNRVLSDVNLRVKRGQFLSLVGPSGCGKSTLLRAIVGTHLPLEGQILTRASVSSTLQPVQGPGRDRGIVYQHYSLFPFLTARDNVAVGLLLDETSLPFRLFRPFQWRNLRKTHRRRAEEFLARLKLEDAIHLFPHEMSGGMRQRVAIAQALIMKPEIILLDEPFGALDEATREELQNMLLDLYAANRKAIELNLPPPYTLIIVTHELNEAIYVGDRIAGLSQFWSWQDQGHASFPGARIIYDRLAPIYEVGERPDYQSFDAQRDEIRRLVFDPNTCQDPQEHLTYWATASQSFPTPDA